MLSKTSRNKAIRGLLLKVDKQRTAEDNWNGNLPVKSADCCVVRFPESKRGCAAEVFGKQKLKAKQVMSQLHVCVWKREPKSSRQIGG